MLLDAIAKAEVGETPIYARPDGAALPVTVDGVAPANEWADYWRAADLKRRRAAPWQTP